MTDDDIQTVRLKVHGRMYIAITEEAIQDANIIIGTFLIHSVPAGVLFDFGSMHIFLARAFVDKICLSQLGHDLVVSPRECLREAFLLLSSSYTAC